MLRPGSPGLWVLVRHHQLFPSQVDTYHRAVRDVAGEQRPPDPCFDLADDESA